jgi:putative transposase
VGASLKGVVGTTWAPKGQTPTVQHCCKWEKLSCIGAISLEGQLLEQSYEHTITGVQVQDFLQKLAKGVEGKLLVFWDNAPIHRSRLVKTYLESDEGKRFTIVPLPPYAPECNPIEWLWAWVKKNHLANLAAKNLDELKAAWQRALEAARSNKDLICACFYASAIAHVLKLP